MPWSTPTLAEIRRTNRDNLSAFLPGADASVPNSALRVLSDQNAGGAYLNLLYLDWLAKNLLPDQSEGVFLDRWAEILFGGRKAATFAAGRLSVSGTAGTMLPAGSVFSTSDAVQYQTAADIRLSAAVTPVAVTCLSAGALGNRDAGTALTLAAAISGVAAQASALTLAGGADAESDDDLRTRVLLRIRNPPMGGRDMDYVQWALSLPGVTRAWCSPMEMGIGTVTVRVMCDELRASANGFPSPVDLAIVRAYIDTVRPVTVADYFVLAPIAYGLDIRIKNLSNDTPSMRLSIAAAIRAMLAERAAPGATIYAAWISAAISEAVGDGSFELIFADAVMPSKGHMAVLSPGPGISYPSDIAGTA